ncbi:hypothetical protein [Paenibacillus sedimenti]|uniref:Lipoprotein n=1 Tax=Paenibacillus sedimenti TaxID=2770274 RepID=A0A926KPC3_9BACL|nr:hypothetical protein [Paenibacillus sedimenti]MBD0381435.1 hypothetical protein [Paenibacillus sedimenti]
MLNLKRFGVLSILLLATTGMASGCGVSEKVAERTAEKLIEQSTGVKVDKEGEAITVTSKDGQQLQISGEAKKLPDGFPLPSHPDAKIESSMTSTENGAKSFIVALTSSKPIKDLAAFYEKALQDKGIKPERTDLNDEGADSLNSVFLNGKSDKLEATVQIVKDESNEGKESYMINLIVRQAE